MRQTSSGSWLEFEQTMRRMSLLEIVKSRRVSAVPAAPGTFDQQPEVTTPIQTKPSLPSRVAVIGNYLPRQCGIATFTTDLCEALSAEYGTARLLAVPVNDTEPGYNYPARVRWT